MDNCQAHCVYTCSAYVDKSVEKKRSGFRLLTPPLRPTPRFSAQSLNEVDPEKV